jgi:hypothetical protein
MSKQFQPQAKAASTPVSTPTPSFTPVQSGLIQRKCACGGAAGLSGGCQECSNNQLAVQRRAANQAEPSTAPQIAHEVLGSPGQPLDAETRAFMEPRFGHDFSQVRVHTDMKAAESARALNALAYTVGPDVVFGSGQYAPQSSEGQRLLAHELTHVLQQQGTANTVAASSELRVSNPSDPSEREADRSASQVMSGQPSYPIHSSAVAQPNRLQRAVGFDECTPAEETVVLDSHTRAIDMVTNAVAKLGTYNGTTPADVKTALNKHFHSSGTGLAAWIAYNLNWLKGQSDSPTYECEKPQVGKRLGWSMWCVPFTDIELYPLWFAEPDIDIRARTMIHEWVHRYGCNFDFGYEWQSGYSGHGTLRSLLNADTWAHLVYDVR